MKSFLKGLVKVVAAVVVGAVVAAPVVFVGHAPWVAAVVFVVVALQVAGS